MTTEQYSLSLTNSTATDSTFSFSDKNIAAGYHRISGGLHTAIVDLIDFVGTVKLQATLSLYPGDSDWFDVVDAQTISSDALSTTVAHTFTGNFLWLRAAYNIQSGSIGSITYSF